MGKIKRLQKWIPEIYLIASILYYWIMTGTFVNIIAMVLLFVLMILIVWKNTLLGTTISIVLLALNLYMVLALISELMEFPAFNRDAQILLFFGLTYLGLNIFLSTAMLMKWGKNISPSHAAD